MDAVSASTTQKGKTASAAWTFTMTPPGGHLTPTAAEVRISYCALQANETKVAFTVLSVLWDAHTDSSC